MSVNESAKPTKSELESFRVNKRIPKALENEILFALSFYPSLKSTCIRFRFKQKIRGSVMQAQPDVPGLLRGRRAYNINISALFRLTHTAIPIQQIPSDVIVGWVGHELGHVMDYEKRKLWGIVRFGAGYLFSSTYVKKAERVADTFAVNHGLGSYILKTKHFILDHASLSEQYKNKIARLYLSPDDIVEQVRLLEEARKLPS